MTFKEKVYKFLHWDYSDIVDNPEYVNEIKANRLCAIVMFNITVISLVSMLIFGLAKFLDFKTVIQFVIYISIELLIPSILCFVFKGRKKWLKHILLIGFCLGMALLYVFLSVNAVLLMALPIIVSCSYNSKKCVLSVSVVIILNLILGTFANVGLKTFDTHSITFLDGATINIASGEYIEDGILKILTRAEVIKQLLIKSTLPNILITIVVSEVAFFSAKNGKETQKVELALKVKEAGLEKELNLATQIQESMLPRIFPPFPEHQEFDIYASMDPAKEIGGDFYDFFMLDDSHVAIVIGDVSGKGIPAALFMVTAKTLIKDYSQLRLEPAEVFTRVNKILCEGNEAGLFVTGWLGILDLDTKVLTYVNAGHNPPLLMLDDHFEFLKARPGFVLAGMDGVKYKQQQITLTVNSRILLYTDGITEAINSENVQYGNDRLVQKLDELKNTPIKDALIKIKADVDNFAEDMPQFDDMTMLMLVYRGKQDENVKELVVQATKENLSVVNSFVEEELEKHDASMKVLNAFELSLEELYVNIVNYGYVGRIGEVKIILSIKDDVVKLSLKDSGIPFNPLENGDPNINASAEERQIGGLGIFLVKKMMDNVTYEYVDEMNIVTIEKHL